ncbi:MAG: hypothetical protein JMM79_01220 [Candidatus Xiphinematobacter sp.]|nr:MAG: hypothetical protein JMM79_01220 [Candidatus Xiphinematobacter sp.]
MNSVSARKPAGSWGVPFLVSESTTRFVTVREQFAAAFFVSTVVGLQFSTVNDYFVTKLVALDCVTHKSACCTFSGNVKGFSLPRGFRCRQAKRGASPFSR